MALVVTLVWQLKNLQTASPSNVQLIWYHTSIVLLTLLYPHNYKSCQELIDDVSNGS